MKHQRFVLCVKISASCRRLNKFTQELENDDKQLWICHQRWHLIRVFLYIFGRSLSSFCPPHFEVFKSLNELLDLSYIKWKSAGRDEIWDISRSHECMSEHLKQIIFSFFYYFLLHRISLHTQKSHISLLVQFTVVIVVEATRQQLNELRNFHSLVTPTLVVFFFFFFFRENEKTHWFIYFLRFDLDTSNKSFPPSDLFLFILPKTDNVECCVCSH